MESLDYLSENELKAFELAYVVGLISSTVFLEVLAMAREQGIETAGTDDDFIDIDFQVVPQSEQQQIEYKSI